MHLIEANDIRSNTHKKRWLFPQRIHNPTVNNNDTCLMYVDRWSYLVTGDFPSFRPPSGVSSKVDSGSHAGSRKKLNGSTKGAGVGARGGTNRLRSGAVRTPGGESAATGSSWNGGGGVELGAAFNGVSEGVTGRGGSTAPSPAGGFG